MINKNFLTVILLVLTLSSCKPAKETTQSETPASFVNTEWKLQSVFLIQENQETQELFPDPAMIPTLTINQETGQAGGYAGCNRYSGPVTIKDHSIRFGDIILTKMFCSEGMDIENALMKTLAEADNYMLSNGTFSLKKGNTVLAAFTKSN